MTSHVIEMCAFRLVYWRRDRDRIFFTCFETVLKRRLTHSLIKEGKKHSSLPGQSFEDGACVQIGIGGMPNAVCSLLMESGVKDLGIHTEMLTDGLGLLYRSGRVTGSRKTLDVVCTFALGSLALYATANRNPHWYCHQVDYTNSPHIIMQNDKVVSINNTTQIDLQGQLASESDGHRHLSGTGGQLQFVRGACASKGGKSFICLSSAYEKKGERRSLIVFTLTPLIS